MKKWLAIGGLILVTVIWGGGFVASDMALGSMKPFQIMMVRFLLASVLMGMISMGQHKKEGKLEKRAAAIYNTFQKCIPYSTECSYSAVHCIYNFEEESRHERNHWSNHVRYWSSTAFFEWKSYTESGRWSYTSLCGRICVPNLFYRRICEKISGICTEHGADDHSICIIGSQSCDFWRERFSGYNTGMVKCFVSGSNQYDCMLSAPDRMPEVCR